MPSLAVSPLRTWLRHPHAPLALLLILGAVIGGLTFEDYGLSWDEPLFYSYADSVGYAYSPRERLSGEFDLERAYGPSGSDHKIYGPAYLLLGRGPALLVEGLFAADHKGAWHLVNFLTFEVGVLGLYALSRRWISTWAAFGVALLFLTQPVLWGHAFINPKDIPFMVFFILAVETGLRMVDRLTRRRAFAQMPESVDEQRFRPEPSRRSARALRVLQIVGLALACAALLAFVLGPLLDTWLTEAVLSAYYGPPASFLRRLFLLVATDASHLSEDYYIDRALGVVSAARAALTILAVLLLPLAVDRTTQPHSSLHRFEGLLHNLGLAARSLAFRLRGVDWRDVGKATLVPGLVLGLLTGTRILGPAAGLLVLLYFLAQPRTRNLVAPVVYAAIAALVAYASWPYLWEAPFARFIEVARHMASNPQILPVLFRGEVLASNALPASYLPIQVALTLSEPVLPLAAIGIVVAFRRWQRGRIETDSFLVLILWFVVPFAYVLIRRPPMYDGYRHFLFILPPLFVTAGLAIEAIGNLVQSPWLRAGILLLLAAPGAAGVLVDHPYPYAHYNLFAGGTAGAYRRYETDFWLTCYKETLEMVNSRPDRAQRLYVLRNAPLARYYAFPDIEVLPYEPELGETRVGSWLLATTRSNADASAQPGDPVLLEVGRNGAVFCVVKDVVSVPAHPNSPAP